MTKARDLATSGPDLGLVHIKTESFSGTASHSIDDVFSATYDYYKIFISATADADRDFLFRIRASSSDLTTGTYGYVFTTISQTGGTGTSGNSGTATSAQIGDLHSTNPINLELHIFNPFLSSITGLGFFGGVKRTNFNQLNGSAYVNNTNSYDGFTVYPSSGNMTGKISIFGVKK